MSERTPGPWAAEMNDSCVGYVASIGAGRAAIASVNFADGDGFANARLIAAAPELLEACRALARQVKAMDERRFEDNEPDSEETLKMAAEVIAKAEGITAK